MKKSDVREIMKKHKTAKEKENALKKAGVTFTHDSKQNLIVWCSDGVLEFHPIFK